jgi:hypothetical protein
LDATVSTHPVIVSRVCDDLESEDAFGTDIGATERQDWHSGPIDVEWDTFYASWLWRFPGDDRELPGHVRYRDAG